MITIIEQKSEKVVGSTSLIVLFNYNEQIISILKETGEAVWNKKNKYWELPCSSLSYLIDKLCFIDDIELSLLKDENVECINPTIKYKTSPFDYQLDGITWLINNRNSLLLDFPGLGKSLQIICTAEELKAQKDVEHCLIICGINTLKDNWAKEIKKHSSLDYRIIGKRVNSKGKEKVASMKERADELFNEIDEFFAIINVESLRDSLIVDAIKNSKNNFDMIVFDEVHRVKDPNSNQGSNLLKIAKVGKYHYGLTGTVIVNSPFDAYVPLKFIGKENACFSKFRDFYCVREQRFGRNDIVGFRNLEYLQKEINECSLRRSKDILNLPPKTIIDEYIEMSEEHIKFYDDISKGIVDEADRVEIKNTSLLGLTVRMRQAATCPSTLTTSKMTETKIDRAVQLVEEIVSNNEKVVIFCSFKEPLLKLEKLLEKYKPLIGTGDIDNSVVSDNIDIFQNDPSRKVFIGTQQKMSTGVTLTAASYMILLDSPWTQADFDQETDRIHRIGADKPVIIYNLISTGTIDERVKYLREYKKSISDYLVDCKDNDIKLKNDQRDNYLFLLGIKSRPE